MVTISLFSHLALLQPLLLLPNTAACILNTHAEHDFMQFTNTRFDREGKNKSTIKNILRVDIALLGMEGGDRVYRSSRRGVHMPEDKSLSARFAAKVARGRGTTDMSSSSSSSSSNSSTINTSRDTSTDHSSSVALEGTADVSGGNNGGYSSSVASVPGRPSFSAAQGHGHALDYPEPHQFSGMRIEVEGEGFLYRQVRLTCAHVCCTYRKTGKY